MICPMNSPKITIPQEVQEVISKLHEAKHEAYIVGGCVRDLLLDKEPKDCDVTTSAKPEEILAIFPESFYENAFLTVTVKTESDDPALQEIEVTTFRKEGKYADSRHPDEVAYAQTLEEDLSRRDFTVNAVAFFPPLTKEGWGGFSGKKNPPQSPFIKGEGNTEGLIDPFNGQEDIKKKLIRAVGDAEKRFHEDALRMLRAVRLAIQLDFTIEAETFAAIQKFSGNLKNIANERIRDEFLKLIMTPRAKEGVELLHETGLLKEFLPEIEEGFGVENRPRIFNIWEHNLKALEYAASQNFSMDARVAALLHDVGKPRTKGPMKNGEWTFYGHDVVGGKMARVALKRLCFPHKTVEKIGTLIRWHLFKYELDMDDETTTDSSIRRLIRNVGAENMSDLVKLRICDRMGMGVPKPVPYRLRHFQFRVEKVLREEEAPTPKMLKLTGNDVMNILQIQPGPKIGHMINALLEEVIDDPKKNTAEYLSERVKDLGKLSEEDLIKIRKDAEAKMDMLEEERISSIKEKYYVK